VELFHPAPILTCSPPGAIVGIHNLAAPLDAVFEL
jgi:hypothetical protein